MDNNEIIQETEELEIVREEGTPDEFVQIETMDTQVTEEYNADAIQVLEGLEAVRKRPGMYIGSTGPRGLHHLVYEIVDNSIDEALAGYCTHIEVEILPGDVITVRDNGRGIPVGINEQQGLPAVTVVLTVLHAGGKFGGSGYKVSGGLHGVGSSVVNALSEWLVAEVRQNGARHVMRFARGVPTGPMEVEPYEGESGTTIRFKADAEIFDETEYSFDILLSRLREQAFLNAGLRITLRDERGEEKTERVLHYEGGIRSFVEHINKNREPLHPSVIYLAGGRGDSFAEIALQYNDRYDEGLYSFANNIKTTEGGMHELGFKNALTRILNDYARRQNLLKENDKNLSGEDVREGMTAVISVKLREPQFEGQTKTKLGNAYIKGMVDSAVSEGLSVYMEEHPSESKLIIDKCLQASRAREAARKARDLSRRKTALDSTALPGKLSDCSDKDPSKCELFIVEGDSAGGSAKEGRDRHFQAILPLRGKILNVEKTRLDKMLGNAEIRCMITAFGAGIDSEFDETKLRYHKIICMTDADVDGSHIRTLLLTFFFRHMRPMIEKGYVYIAQPPLYLIKKGNMEKYVYSDEELNRTLDEIGRDRITVQRYKGLGEMNPEQLWDTTMDPEKRIMLQVTMDDAMAADQIFTVLMGDQVEPRREFIEINSKLVADLDI